MDRFLRFIQPEVKTLTNEGRVSEAIYALEETISWSLVQLALIWCDNFTNLDKAEKYLRQAIALQPGKWEFHVNLAHVLNLAFRFEEARDQAQKASDAGFGQIYEPYYNLGVILTNLLDHKAAIEAYRSAIRIGPKNSLASYNISASLLALGQWKEGWETYENRFTAFEKIKAIHDRFRVHYRRGDPTKGRIMYVYSEQGIGDLIQFSRYLPKLKSCTGAKIILEPQIACSKLLADNFKLDGIVPRVDGSWPVVPEEIDYAISVNSLPGFFDAGNKPIPAKPYIKAPERELPDVLKTDKIKVGICWAGNADHANDCKRSMYLKQFAPLFNFDNVQLFSLQKNPGVRKWFGRFVDLNSDVPPCNIIDLSPYFNDFSDTAYYIGQMDLVITVDTSIGHLAGAMGKQVWVLLDRHNDWRWMPEGDTTPWYPTMRFFRQKELFVWEPVVEEVARALAAFQTKPQDQKKSLACDKKGSKKSRSRKHSP